MGKAAGQKERKDARRAIKNKKKFKNRNSIGKARKKVGSAGRYMTRTAAVSKLQLALKAPPPIVRERARALHVLLPALPSVERRPELLDVVVVLFESFEETKGLILSSSPSDQSSPQSPPNDSSSSSSSSYLLRSFTLSFGSSNK